MINRFLNGVVDGILDGHREIYNPTVFYGPLTSTMTVAAQLEHEYRLRFPPRKIVHICGKEFYRMLVQSYIDGTPSDFRKPFLPADLLIFEDIEDIAGRVAAMQEFYTIFDRIFESGGQIVITSACPPHEIPALEDRIRTQLSGGVMVCLERFTRYLNPKERAKREELYRRNRIIGEKIARELWPNEPNE